ncbi:uncharacterized protein TRAVEDRAFT_74391 [Trametes versicolor FP-101664 SS1]|uniref:uncharacterized protein n=1 Tax=Trametes versicolor (strain FP-101664) TaxID=717944 RepID=UPI00046235C1|nr:uncharacterized protein TRAVEDRAFT_74391 [Trametes versicolor FP-101664 SS1]EIW54134.1 hypothetical protein TRAVEDRAFT_74391 [Trametes versicolor FP-101664 SS1]
MLFRSNLHEDIRSSQDLIILCHAQERVLVPLPKTYEDAQQCAKDVFNIAGDVIFVTKDLPATGSVETPVRIHSAAWEGISPVLSSIEVFSADVQRQEPVHIEASASVRRLSSQKRVAGPSAYSSRTHSVAANSSVVERQSTAARKTPLAASKSLSDASASGSVGGASKGPKASTSKGVLSPPGPTVLTRPPLPKVAAPAPIKAPSPAKPPAYVQNAPTWTDEDDEEEELRILSPTKKRVNRPRVLSDYGLEEPEEHSEEETTKLEAPEEEEEEEYDELEDAEYISAAPPAAKTPSSSRMPAISAAKSGSGSSTRGGGSRPLVQLDAMPSASRTPERMPSPKVKVEKGLAKPALPSQVESAPSQPQGKSDESFVIMIEYNDDPESRSLFKTRGRHMVSKVLMQACRTFGLEDYYSSARLVLLVEVEGDGDGEPMVYRSVCDRNDTMAQAGAEPDARFVVEIVDGEENA